MVNKGEKATTATLARGEVLSSELIEVLRLAADGATFVYIRIVWRDEHHAVVRKADDLDPIEDPRNVFSVHGRFVYEDESELSLDLQNFREPGQSSAKGQTARTRQATVSQLWASIPGRAC